MKTAYETLTDPDARRRYDADHSIRRLGFFRDVEEADGEEVGRQADPWEAHRWVQVQEHGLCVCVLHAGKRAW